MRLPASAMNNADEAHSPRRRSAESNTCLCARMVSDVRDLLWKKKKKKKTFCGLIMGPADLGLPF